MKTVLFSVLSALSLAGLVACGAPTNVDEGTEAPEASLGTETDSTMADDGAVDNEMQTDAGEATSVGATDVSDSDLEMKIQDNLATLYPETTFDVTAVAGAVTIAGAIPTQAEADYIADWVAEIEGVTEVEVMPSEGTTDL